MRCSVNEANEIQESFVDLILYHTRVTESALTQDILEVLQEYSLNVGNLRVEGYDGAGTLARKCHDTTVCI